MPAALPAVLALPVHVVTTVYDLAHAVGPKSDGGRKVTIAELEQLETDAARLLADVSALLATHRAATGGAGL